MRAADAALLFNTVVWGATFVLVKAALADVSPILFLALRFSLASLALAVVFRRGAAAAWSWKTARAGGLAGVFLCSGYALQTLGLRLTSAPKSAFLTGLTSVMVPLLGALVYRSRPQVSELVGVLVATAGLGLMTLKGVTGTIGPGDALTLLGAVAFAAQIVTLGHYSGGHFSGQMSFEVLSVSQIGAAAVLALGAFWWVETPRVAWRPAVVWGILITGLVCTALAYTIQAWAQQYANSTRTALIYMLEPVFAWITSFLLAGEGLSGQARAGAALILGGVLLVELKPLNSRRHPSP